MRFEYFSSLVSRFLSSVSDGCDPAKTPRNSVSTALAVFVAVVSLLPAACSSKPDTALCGRYYRHMLTIQEHYGQPGALAGLKTQGAKHAVLDHCMQLNTTQVQCVLESEGTADATLCERSERSFAGNDPISAAADAPQSDTDSASSAPRLESNSTPVGDPERPVPEN